MSVNHPTDLLPAYALGCLEEADRQEVRRHLRVCDDCRRELAAFQDVTGRLGFGAPSARPPDHLKKRLMMRIGARSRGIGWFERMASAWPRLMPAGGVAGLILIIALGAFNLVLWQRMQGYKTGAFEHAQLVRLQATAEASGAFGTLIISPDGLRAILLVDALRPLPKESQYQLWLISQGRRTSGGVFSVAADGSAKILVAADRPLSDFDAFGVTVEPYGGSPGPTGKKVLGGKWPDTI